MEENERLQVELAHIRYLAKDSLENFQINEKIREKFHVKDRGANAELTKSLIAKYEKTMSYYFGESVV